MSAADARPSVDTRTRSLRALPAVDPAEFWAGAWTGALGTERRPRR